MSKSTFNSSDQSKTPSRRTFLKTSGLVVGSAMAGSLAAPAVHAAGKEEVRVGLVGCGGRGSGAATNILNAGKHVKLVAMADAFEDKVKGARERLKKAYPEQVQVPDEKCFVKFGYQDELINSDVDIVLLCAPPVFRPKHIEMAVKAGKHMFAEKPVAVDPPGLRHAMTWCEEAKKKGLSLVAGLCWRYHTGVQQVMAKIQEGAIGDIVAIEENYLRGTIRDYGARDFSKKESEMEYQVRNWYHFNWLSGDGPGQSLIHSIDKAAWALGEQTPATVWGMGGRQVHTAPQYGDLFDHHGMIFEMADGRRVYGNTRTILGCYNSTTDHIFGTEGNCNLTKMTITDRAGKLKWKFRDKMPRNMYDEEQFVLAESVRKGEPVYDGKTLCQSSMWTILGSMACYTGKRWTWEEGLASNWDMTPKEFSLDAKPPVVPDENGNYPTFLPGMSKLG